MSLKTRARAKHSAMAFVIAVTAAGRAHQSGALTPALGHVANALSGAKLFVSGDSPARRQADEWRRSRPADAALMTYVASQATARWIGEWTRDVRAEVSDVARRAAGVGAVPVFVAYNIPNRDCGNSSAGGASNAQ